MKEVIPMIEFIGPLYCFMDIAVFINTVWKTLDVLSAWSGSLSVCIRVLAYGLLIWVLNKCNKMTLEMSKSTKWDFFIRNCKMKVYMIFLIVEKHNICAQGYRYHKLRKTFGKFFRSYCELLSKFVDTSFQESSLDFAFKRNHASGLLRWSTLQTKDGQRRSEFYLVGL